MNGKTTVSLDTLWTVLPVLLTRIKDIRVMMKQCGERHTKYYDFNKSILEECISAYNEISGALGLGGISSVVEMPNETEV